MRSLGLNCYLVSNANVLQLDPLPLSALRHLDVFGDLSTIRSLAHYIKDSDHLHSVTLRGSGECLCAHHPIDSVAQALLPLASRLHSFSAPDGWELSRAFEHLLSTMTSLQDLELGYRFRLTPAGSFLSHNLPSAPTLGQLTSLRKLTIRDAGKAHATTGPLTTLHMMLSTSASALEHLKLDASLTTSWPEGAKAHLESTAEAAGVRLVFVV
jgi:hypothetical protein